jgi:hypothetical protein
MSLPESGDEFIRHPKRQRSLLLPAAILLALVPAAGLIFSAYAYVRDAGDRTT